MPEDGQAMPPPDAPPGDVAPAPTLDVERLELEEKPPALDRTYEETASELRDGAEAGVELVNLERYEYIVEATERETWMAVSVDRPELYAEGVTPEEAAAHLRTVLAMVFSNAAAAELVQIPSPAAVGGAGDGPPLPFEPGPGPSPGAVEAHRNAVAAAAAVDLERENAHAKSTPLPPTYVGMPQAVAPRWFKVTTGIVFSDDGFPVRIDAGAKVSEQSHDLEKLKRLGAVLEECEAPTVGRDAYGDPLGR